MALPSFEQIQEYYRQGLWTDSMLKTALVCKAITQPQYDQLLDEKRDKAASKGKK